MRRSTTTVLGFVAATSLLAGCGSSPTETSAEAAESGSGSKTRATPSATGQSNFIPTATDSAADKAPRVPFGTSPQVVKSKGAWDLVLRDVRVGQHDGFERVVLDFAGSGRPGWDARYVNTPKADGSGELVDINGDSFLGVAISGVTIRESYPDTAADFYGGPRHFAPEQSGAIEDVKLVGVFEGYEQLFLGVHGDKRPFRVFALTEPSRLVVDVRDD